MANLSVLMLWPGLIVSGSMASRLASALMGEACELLFISAMPDRPVPEVEGCESVPDPVHGHENVWDCCCHKQSCRSWSRGEMNRCRATGWGCYILPTSMLDPTVVHKETKIQYLAYIYPSQPLCCKRVNTALKLIIFRQTLFNT